MENTTITSEGKRGSARRKATRMTMTNAKIPTEHTTITCWGEKGWVWGWVWGKSEYTWNIPPILLADKKKGVVCTAHASETLSEERERVEKGFEKETIIN